MSFPLAAVLAGFLLGAPGVHAADRDAVAALIEKAAESHDRMRAAEAAADGARNALRVSHGGWYPTVSVAVNGGREVTDKPSPQTRTDLNANQVSFRATQLLWDFDATNADVRRSQWNLIRSEVAIERTRQDLLIEGLSAYANLARAHNLLLYARQSEANIQRQTGLEEVRLSEGFGQSTDVLQAKSQLAGAQARRVAAQEAMQNALNRFQAFYGHVELATDTRDVLAPPKAALPLTLDQAIDEARKHNPLLQELALSTAAAKEGIESVRGRSLYPRVEGVVERNLKDNVTGQLGRQSETVFKVQVTFALNAGLTAVNTLRIAEAELRLADATWADQERQVLETVRNSWSRLQSARLQAQLLRDQASLAEGFLEVARSERELGTRSLIDLLAGETTLINARSDALAAETEEVLAAYRLLSAIGQLEAGHIQTRALVERQSPGARGSNAQGRDRTGRAR
ncbi:TolC family protein [Arenibaculum pallidiluteum]|uniref:TolC family protein n=1 Tax=Arenibaculum pallidiluteum TaxID=2812559 RepID=UPI001F3A3C8A|nr:TolC family protein [Arenibaculum pallidiluteum]